METRSFLCVLVGGIDNRGIKLSTSCREQLVLDTVNVFAGSSYEAGAHGAC